MPKTLHSGVFPNQDDMAKLKNWAKKFRKFEKLSFFSLEPLPISKWLQIENYSTL